MWQRRQLKAQRRRQQNPNNSSNSASARDKRDRVLFSRLVVVACVLVVFVALLQGYDGDRRTSPPHSSEWSLVMRFLRDYPRRFAAFYAPKVQLLVDWSIALYETLEISDDVTSALDFAVALVVITSVYHLIEIGRRAILSRVQQTQGTKIPDNDDPGALACDAF